MAIEKWIFYLRIAKKTWIRIHNKTCRYLRIRNTALVVQSENTYRYHPSYKAYKITGTSFINIKAPNSQKLQPGSGKRPFMILDLEPDDLNIPPPPCPNLGCASYLWGSSWPVSLVAASQAWRTSSPIAEQAQRPTSLNSQVDHFSPF